MPRPVRDPILRFFEKVEYADDGCWNWTAALTGTGYGQFTLVGRRTIRRFVVAHRFAYELLVGPIPGDLQLDHLCRNRRCVNPDHLEPVTNRENSQRGLKGRMVTRCVRGHDYTEANTVIRKDGRRACRTCRLENSRRANAKRARRCAECGVKISHGRMRCRVHAQRFRRGQ